MREKKIQKLIELVEKSNIDQLEVTRWGTKVKIMKNAGAVAPRPVTVASQPVEVHVPQPVQSAIEAPAAPQATAPAPPVASNLVEIKSPMVGTFYRAPSPDAEPYVKIGDTITVGQVLCIVEAMKLMNEIEAEISGKIVDIMVENAKPVEYNQVLFRVEPSK